MKYLLTAQVLNMFLLTAFALETDNLTKKLEVLSIVLLSYITMIADVRDQIPDI